MGRIASILRRPLLRGARLIRARSGNAAVVVALALPALATFALGATDVASIMNDRQRMRSIAEGAALAGARNLSVAMSESDAKTQARAMAEAMISEWRHGPRLAVTVTIENIDQEKAVRVRLDAQRPSFFGDLLPPGGWKYDQQATASSVGARPLCVLSFSEDKKRLFELKQNPEIRAPECLIHSNGDLAVTGGSILAGQTQAVGAATGDIQPAPITDAPKIKDPFADLQIGADGLLCLSQSMKISLALMTSGTVTLQPGVHCGVINVGGTGVVRLAPGEHRFTLGSMVLRGNAQLIGDDAVLIFDSAWSLRFTESAKINLSGRRSGVFTGFVMMASRSNKQKFQIDSTHVERLDGVVYIPSAELRIGGKSDIARQSDWTVVVADRITMSGNPRLYLNADYDTSPIAPPAGVGPRRDGARLVD